MTAPKGNKYWQFREKHGRDHKYTPEGLWDEVVKYYDWVEENPLKEEKLFSYKGEVTRESISKMRAMTISGFCLFADISFDTFQNYKNDEGFLDITTRIENIIKTTKFEGAAADLLNPNIIARDLAIKENVEHAINPVMPTMITIERRK